MQLNPTHGPERLALRASSILRSSAVAIAALMLAACSDGADMDGTPLDGVGGAAGGGGAASGGAAGTANTGGADSSGEVPETLGPDERPATLFAPSQHDGTTPLPLVILLHGFGATAPLQTAYFRASDDAERAGYYLLTPDGTESSDGRQFWNATPACCDMDGSEVDDVAYLTALLDEAVEVLPVDEERVYFIGHSNGGFMSYRMACELSERVAAIMSLAGADFLSETDCVPTEPVSVLQVHGDVDDTVPFDGSSWYPSAEETVKRWALRAGCDDVQTSGAAIDLDSTVDGAETVVTEWSTGCDAGHEAALWRMEAVGHLPRFSRDWMPAVSEWLLRHRR